MNKCYSIIIWDAIETNIFILSIEVLCVATDNIKIKNSRYLHEELSC